MNKIPCFVISYNRPSFLKCCIEALAKEERLDVIIISNDGFDYNGYGHEIINTKTICPGQNYGHKVCWSQDLIPKDQPYLVTDCDIIVPQKLNWLDILLNGMNRLPNYNKFGLGLNTRHIPDSNKQKENIINHENKVIHRKNIGDPHFYEAPVDTTMALYRAGFTNYSIWGNDSELEFTGECKSVRTFPPYEAIHLTWQMTPQEIAGDENQNYLRMINKNSTHWSEK